MRKKNKKFNPGLVFFFNYLFTYLSNLKFESVTVKPLFSNLTN